MVVDNTNPAPEDRAPLVAGARAAGVGVRAVWLDTPVPVCAARNDAREGRARVPPAGLYGTAARVVAPPTAEGFDRVGGVTAGRRARGEPQRAGAGACGRHSRMAKGGARHARAGGGA